MLISISLTLIQLWVYKCFKVYLCMKKMQYSVICARIENETWHSLSNNLGSHSEVENLVKEELQKHSDKIIVCIESLPPKYIEFPFEFPWRYSLVLRPVHRTVTEKENSPKVPRCM